MNKKVEVLTEIIKARRSIFPPQYIDCEIDDRIIKDILANANWAPNHKLTEPWRFKVLKGEAKGRLGDFMASKYKCECTGDRFLEKKYQKLLSNPRRAAAIILICMQRDAEERLPEWEELAAVSMAVQNMWLTSHAHGIGAYWSSPAFIDKMDEFVDLNSGEKCLGIFYMGYYEESPAMPQRDTIESKVEWVTE